MRVNTTTSDSGPVPRSHSPRFGSRLSRFIRAFLLADQVAEPRRLFVVLGSARRGHLLVKLPQFRFPDQSAERPGHLPGVPGRPMNPLQQRLQDGPEGVVVGGAPEPALGAELSIL